VLVHPRVALASGLAAAAGAALMLFGRIDGSIVTVLALAVAARAAAPAASGSVEAPAASSRQIAAIPVWVAVAVAAVMRIESSSLDAALGANAVAGPALVRGGALMVAGSWVAVVAGTMAVVTGFGATRPIVPEKPFATLEVIGVAVQVLLLAALFAGPQIDEIADAIPWVVAVAAIGGVVIAARSLARWDWVSRLAMVLGVAAVALTVAGSPP